MEQYSKVTRPKCLNNCQHPTTFCETFCNIQWNFLTDLKCHGINADNNFVVEKMLVYQVKLPLLPCSLIVSKCEMLSFGIHP